MDVGNICAMGATCLARKISTRELSAREVVAAHLDRIDAVNPRLNALVTDRAEAALNDAEAVDGRLARGEQSRPLEGVPISVKDLLDVAGLPCVAGVASRKFCVPTQDATIVRRLREAGAIVLGKTNVPDLGDAVETDNLVFGRTNNPFDLARTPGGSSGGEAALIAAFGVPLGLGSDSGGSIRIPAHFCGIAGMKPTFGKLPRTGIYPPALGVGHERNQPGPMARTVRDVGLALRLIEGPDGTDPSVVPLPTRRNSVQFDGLRIAFHTDNGIVTPNVETIDVIRRCAAALSRLGAIVEEARPSGIEETAELMFAHRTASDNKSAQYRNLAGTSETTPVVNRCAEAARVYSKSLSIDEFFQHTVRLNRFRGRMLQFMTSFDAILCPVTDQPALHHGEFCTAAHVLGISYTQTYSLTGWPSATVRGGTSSEGLPIGVQIAARPWFDDVTLAVAAALECEMGPWPGPDL